MLNKLFEVIFYVWQILQNILGLLFILFYYIGIFKGEIKYYKKIGYSYIYKVKGWKKFGLCLGNYIFVSLDERGEELVYHEMGHGFQSRFLGPFFIFIIGIYSVLRYWYFENKIKKNMDKEKELWKQYHKGYPEGWANRVAKGIRSNND